MTDGLVREGNVRTSKPLPSAALRDGRLSFGARASLTPFLDNSLVASGCSVLVMFSG